LFLGGGHSGDLLDLYHQGEYTKVGSSEIRQVEVIDGAIDLHINAILKALGPLPSSARKLRVVLDSCNGAGSVIGTRLLEALGAEAIPIHNVPDGLFPRPAEPTPENLGILCEAVCRHHADIGFAQDMDADRLAVVAESGKPIGEELTLVLATRFVLTREQGPVVVNLSTTHTIEIVAKRFGCPVIRTRIGEANVADGMKREKAVIGGEGNGGVIYPRINFARDSLVGMALILHLLSESQRSLSSLLSEFPPNQMIKEKLECPSDKIRGVLNLIRTQYENHPMDLRDGVKVKVEGGWFQVRGSNTERIIRLVAEAESTQVLDRIRSTVFQQVREYLMA
jgi:phosphomannomutase